MEKQRVWLPLAALTLSMLAGTAQSQPSQVERMRAALASPERPEANRVRDEIRRPIDVIQFLGIEDGDNALDVIAFGGWYTEVLSAAVGPDGMVYSQNPPFMVNRPGFEEQEQALMARLGNVTPVHGDIAAAGIDGQMDAAITALNLHDIYNMGGDEAALALLRSVYGALRSGGVFGVIDHRGIAGQPNDDFHRIQLADARRLLREAGFVIEAESDLLANPADDHMRPVRDPSLNGRSDRFLIRARKP
jgi:predicted methyltransferase